MTDEAIVRLVAEQIAALRPRFAQLRGFDPAACSGLAIHYAQGVSEVANPNYPRLLAEYEAEVRAEPYRKRAPPPSPTMPHYASDGVELMIQFMPAEYAAMSAATRLPGREIGNLVYDLWIHGPDTAEHAELYRAIVDVLQDAQRRVR